jgi:hypothetical protein
MCGVIGIRPLIEADVPLKLRTIYIRNCSISELIERKIGRIDPRN